MAFFSTWSERADASWRMLSAYAMMAALLLLNIASITLPLTGVIKAPLFLMAVYYWAVYRPTLMPVWLVFLCGCVMDFIGGFPLGLNALTFVIMRWVGVSQRRFLMSQNFFMIWVGFALFSTVANFGQWVLYSLVTFSWVPLKAVFFTTLLGIALFPLICIVLHTTHKLLPAPARAFSLKS